MIFQFVSDDQFVRPIKEMIRLYSISRKVYVYTLSYEGLLGSDDRDIPGNFRKSSSFLEQILKYLFQE